MSPVTKVALVQFDNRPRDQLGPYSFLMRRNADYAARHGYDYHFFDQAQFDLPVYWQKPILCRRVLQAGYDLVLWLDTDAVVHDLNRRAETLFEGGEVMVGATDNPLWGQPFNAGVWAARGEAGGDILRRWADLFPNTRWRRTDKAWICEEEWAGPDFEQGAFTAHLLAELQTSGALRLLDWRVLQAPFPVGGAFTLHFAGPFKVNLPVYLHLTGMVGGAVEPA